MTLEIFDVLAAIRATPGVTEGLELAAEAYDRGLPEEATELLRNAARFVVVQHPELSAAGVQLVLGELVAKIRQDAERAAHVN